MVRRLMARSLVLVVVAALAGCLDSDDAATPDDAATGPLGPIDDSVADMYVVATDNSLNLEASWKLRPSSFQVPVGHTVNVTLSSANGNMFEHTLLIEGLDVHLGPVTEGQRTSTLIVLDSPGTYAYYCDVGNHRQLGMEGTLTVQG